jgi:calcium/calmodulin-dependent protein kinase I
MKTVLEAVCYLHEQGVIHRDLKTANILLNDPDDLSSIKIIDFGFGDTKASYDDHVGTLIYMAPEVAFQHQYSKSVDVWAIGIIMHYVMTGGRHPFYEKGDNIESFKKKLSGLK